MSRISRRPACYAGLLFLLVTFHSPCAEDTQKYEADSLYFPFNSSVMQFDPSAGTLHSYMNTSYFFQSRYSRTGNILWLSARSDDKGENYILILDLEKRSIVKLISGRFSSIAISYPYIVTVSQAFETGKGFLLSVSVIQKNNRVVELLKTHSDFFLSDYETLGDTIVLSGSDSGNKIDCIEAISVKDKSFSTLIKIPKEKGTIKLVKSPESILAYYSTAIEKREKNKAFLIFPKPGRSKEFPYIELAPIATGYDFYGKGCYANGEFIIPAIDVKKKIHFIFLSIREGGSTDRVRRIEAPTGMYTVHDITRNSIIFTGYNYFDSMTDFFIVRLRIDSKNKNQFDIHELIKETQ
jgi:hypothetical protein